MQWYRRSPKRNNTIIFLVVITLSFLVFNSPVVETTKQGTVYIELHRPTDDVGPEIAAVKVSTRFNETWCYIKKGGLCSAEYVISWISKFNFKQCIADALIVTPEHSPENEYPYTICHGQRVEIVDRI